MSTLEEQKAQRERIHKQKCIEVLKYIRAHIRATGVSPSVRELCAGTHTFSTATMHSYLHRLQDEGKLRMNEGKKRTIILLDKNGVPIINGIEDLPEIENPENDLTYMDFSGLTDERYVIVRAQKDQTPVHMGDLLLVERTRKGDFLVTEDKKGKIEIVPRDEPRSGRILGSLVMSMRQFADFSAPRKYKDIQKYQKIRSSERPEIPRKSPKKAPEITSGILPEEISEKISETTPEITSPETSVPDSGNN